MSCDPDLVRSQRPTDSDPFSSLPGIYDSFVSDPNNDRCIRRDTGAPGTDRCAERRCSAHSISLFLSLQPDISIFFRLRRWSLRRNVII